MENIFIYFIKTSGLIGLFYLAYMLLLRRETFFNANRWFLLSGLITSSVLPLFFITKVIWVEPTTDSFDWSTIPVTTSATAPEPEINWYLVLACIYFTGIAISFLKLVFDFNSLIQLLKGKTIQQQGCFKLIDIAENIAPFSYFNYIVYNSSLYTAVELENILEHEKVHSEQKHSVDVLISRLFCVIFWFNPFIWLYKKAIAQNLEFIADSEAAKRIADKKAYQLTLLKITTLNNCVALTNHFYQSLIKKRIIMLNQNQSKKWNSWKYITVFPALVAFVLLFQIEVIAQEKETPKQENEKKSLKDQSTEILVTKNTTDEELKKYCEELKKTHDIDLSFFNIKRNSKDEIINIESKFKSPFGSGTNFQSRTPIKPFKFFYENSSIGYLNLDFSSVSNDNNVYIDGEKSTEEELAQLDPKEIEKIDVATISGKKTILVTTKHSINKTTIKVTDKDTYINDTKSTKEELAQLDDKTNVRSVLKQNSESKPVIVLNGSLNTSLKIEDINPDKIQSINVLKGNHATMKYGENGKNGILEIITKEKIGKNEFQSLQGKTVQGFQISKQEKTKNNTDYFPLQGPVKRPPIIIINGVKTNGISNANEINPDVIESMNVLKEKSAIEKYGDAGKFGVIEIITNTDDPSKILKTPKENKDWIAQYGTYGESNLKNKIIENKSLNYKKAVIVINGKQSDYKILENLGPNEIEFAIQADIKKAPEEDKNKAIKLYGKKALNGFIQIRTKTPTTK